MKIHIYKVFGNDGGWTSTSNLIAAGSTLVQAPSSQASFISHNLFSTAFQDKIVLKMGQMSSTCRLADPLLVEQKMKFSGAF